jgi:hypothetical protein
MRHAEARAPQRFLSVQTGSFQKRRPAASGNSALQVSQITFPQPFGATGLNLGEVKMVVQYTVPAIYQ